MANTPAITTSFKTELMLGAHQFGTVTLVSRTSLTNPTTDTFKAALYLATATLGAATATYSATGEVSDASYTAGGITITNASAPTNTGTTAWWNGSASWVWNALTLATSFDTVLLYNSTQSNRAVAVFTFGGQTINNGTLTLSMPASDSTHALIQLA
jgi:hypothetical protein